MQDPLTPSFLIKLLLIVFLLAIFMWLFIYLTRGGEIRRGGISNAFINDDEGHQNAFMADIQASEIDNAFNNKKKGQQFFPGLRVTR
ncbi:hypothetical protein PHAVU_007G081200 [Phaseolus vulgaris]|uniref:Uncharacterized protein n=1 Tax=Phaseolus vulgaris TaxID=3885 RepID=V7BGD5_PHAVU|nr:hypothetical protein PHAVU_007G081200g [Phaseolus vulgaris]ESW15546.1 hypothetical protein PHAVU_007G081200g [Phaseolus vulgaris]